MDEFLQLPLVNLAAGAFITYLLALRRSRREEVDRLFLQAMAGVAQLQATRFIESGAPAGLFDASEHELASLISEVQGESFKAYVLAAREARLRLASIYPYCPEIRPFFEKFEIAPDEVDVVLTKLERGRRRARSLRGIRHSRAKRNPTSGV